jgi:hypothetical protein
LERFARLLTRPELLDDPDQVRAVRLADQLKHPGGRLRSKLTIESARKGLLLRFAASEGGISHGLGGAGAAQVRFGRRGGALHPLIPELLHVCGERSRAGLLDLRQGCLACGGRGWCIGTRPRGCEQGNCGDNGQGSHPSIEPRRIFTVKLISAAPGLIIRLGLMGSHSPHEPSLH